jgi:UDP-N-acetylmuramoyl-L-alanyl-D-glutamate--2,6-diaminopimelate ligase
VTLGDLLARAGAVVALDGVGELPVDVRGRPVAGVEYDSRRVGPGAVFVGVRGQRADGALFGVQALERGAVAVVAESPAPPGTPGAWLTTNDARLALAALAATFYRHPSEELLVVGVTGTNGKTTTTYLLQAIFQAAGLATGRIGTTGYQIGGVEHELARTTPEAPDVQRLLRRMVDERCTACAMEVSSHALALRRVDQMRFSAGLFTNLTRDHLDFHGGMEPYFAAKRRLFDLLSDGGPVVVNVDDAYGDRLARDFPRATTFSVDRAADVRPEGLAPSIDGLRFEAQTPQGRVSIDSGLVGRANAYNILGAVATAVALDLPRSGIERGIRLLASVPGRFERVSTPSDDIGVIVDYAHTDDALRGLLETARPLARGRLVVVFGCGGDRDRTKRPLMGAVAARLSDVAIVTSDNPRSEDPRAIIEDVTAGFAPADRPVSRPGATLAMPRVATWTVVVDRREAIERAIATAGPGDLVVLAGKGHERTQEIAGRLLPFDDAAVAREALARRRGRRTTAGGPA